MMRKIDQDIRFVNTLNNNIALNKNIIKYIINIIMVSSITSIIDGIYIGDYEAALDNRTLKKHNINVVINCTTKNSKTNLEVIHERIPINENPTTKNMMYLVSSFTNIIHQINKYVSEDKNILIHCENGYQCSPTIVVIYLMVNYGLNLQDSVVFIRNYRSICFNRGVNYIKCLREIERNLNNQVIIE